MCDCNERNCGHGGRGRQGGCCGETKSNCGCRDDSGCGCGCGGSDGCCSGKEESCSSSDCGCECGGFRRRFKNKAEIIAELESYLAELKAEIQGVEERLTELRG